MNEKRHRAHPEQQSAQQVSGSNIWRRGFLWAVAVSPDRTQDIRIQTLGTFGVIDTYLKDAGLDRTRIVKMRSW